MHRILARSNVSFPPIADLGDWEQVTCRMNARLPPEPVVLAHTSWANFWSFVIGPFAAVAILAVLFSDRSIDQIMFVENWARPTRHLPLPSGGVLASGAWFFLASYVARKLRRAGGKYLWVSESWLCIADQPAVLLAHIDPDQIILHDGIVRKRLQLGTTNGDRRVIRMSLAAFDGGSLVETLRRLVEEHRHGPGTPYHQVRLLSSLTAQRT